MREGRRQRLGLQEGTEGTVEDTYLDRILEEEGPRTLALDPDAFVDTRDQRYVQDAYNYYLGGGFPEEPEPVIDTPVIDTTPVVDAGGGGGGARAVHPRGCDRWRCAPGVDTGPGRDRGPGGVQGRGRGVDRQARRGADRECRHQPDPHRHPGHPARDGR